MCVSAPLAPPDARATAKFPLIPISDWTGNLIHINTLAQRLPHSVTRGFFGRPSSVLTGASFCETKKIKGTLDEVHAQSRARRQPPRPRRLRRQRRRCGG